MEEIQLQRVIEALLFVADRSVTMEQIRTVTQAETAKIRQCLEAMREEYDRAGRGFRLREIAGGYCFVTADELSGFVKAYALSKEKRRLSTASLETLSIVAYRQPITRAEIEFIRGVNVEGGIHTLVEKGLIKIVGRKEVPGRPLLYGTTRQFLDHFGLGNLKDLPKLAEFTEKDIELPESLREAEGAPMQAEAPAAENQDENEGKPQHESEIIEKEN